ncbi:MAG: outer membrane lipoprotein carrier protein LolA, partial [Nitrospirae bacterium]|nr:outer membrane lipoprotein carrier protein LolA [Nitrospirota bacterium]
MSANFTQEKKTKLLNKPIKADGRFLYKQPDRIRWEYKGSVNMQVLFNGKDIWIYYPDLKEADKLTGLSQYGSMMQFDVSTLSRDYTITAKKEKSIIILRLAPKVKGPISQIEMEIPEESAFPRMVKLSDQN